MHEISNFDPYCTAISSINFFRDADDNVILAGHDLGDFHDIVKRAFFLISGSQNYLSDEALTPAQWNHLLVDGFLMENEMRIALGEGRERLASVNLDGIHPRPDWKSKNFPWIVEVYT